MLRSFDHNRSQTYLGAVMAKAIEYGLGTVVASAACFCRVAGEVGFTNDWGFPRSGGRTHKGTDIFARAGTPLVAVEDGVIDRVSNTDVGLGGLTVWLNGDSGTRYYYAHNSLNAAATGERVAGGQVIAYVGNTGNAAFTPPHVHFELHPAGQEDVNPYALVAALCRIN
ncbi:MAG: M23 family metallopeptidase [Acidimicrobiales bacterium]